MAHDKLAGHCGGKRDHGKNLNFCLGIDQEFVDLRESLLHFLARAFDAFRGLRLKQDFCSRWPV